MMRHLFKFIIFNILDLPKTLYFNYYYFGLKGILRLPFYVSRKVKLLKIKGAITIEGLFVPGMIKIGYPKVGIFDFKYERTIWEVSGKVNFEENSEIGHGSRISVGDEGKLFIGKNFVITSSSSIVCNNEIRIGHDCLLSWKVLIIDTDYHVIHYCDNNNSIISKPIMIGNKVWIGCNTIILKGTVISDICVVGANSLLTKKYIGNNKLIAGNPASIVKDIYGWEV